MILRKIIKFLSSKKYKWNVKKTEVCIFDEAGSKYIVKALTGIDYYILNTRDYMYIIPLLRLFNEILRLKVDDLYHNYLCHIIKENNPKLVVTYIDNFAHFWRLDKKFGQTIKFLTIQNGMRRFQGNSKIWPEYLDHFFYTKQDPVYHSNFACISDYEKDVYSYHEYSNSQAIVKNFFPIGSLAISDHIEHYVKRKKIFDICLIGNSTNERPVNIKIMQYLSKFVDEHSVSACVAIKESTYSNDWKEHFSIFDEFFGDSTIILIPSKNVNVPSSVIKKRHEVKHPVHSSSYLSDVSEVTIGFASTLLRQTFSRGNKIYPLNFEVDDAGAPFDIQGVKLNPTYEEFEKQLNALLIEDQDDYCKRNKEFMRYVDIFDPNDTPVAKLQRVILKLIG